MTMRVLEKEGWGDGGLRAVEEAALSSRWCHRKNRENSHSSSSSYSSICPSCSFSSSSSFLPFSPLTPLPERGEAYTPVSLGYIFFFALVAVCGTASPPSLPQPTHFSDSS